MKLILLCIAVGAATATSFSNVVGENPNPAAPTDPEQGKSVLLGQHKYTAEWIAGSSSTTGQKSSTDHDQHQASINGSLSILPTHGNDTRVLSRFNKFNHTRHANLSSSVVCDAIECEHEFRWYNGKRTSSIVVTHKCHDDTSGGSDPQYLGSWGDQFKANLTDDAAVKNAKDHCRAETKCTNGHVCGIVVTTSGSQCQCHAWNNLGDHAFNATKPQADKADGVILPGTL